MITAFIFSRDRAQQLRALLESFRLNCPGLFEPYVLWKASDNEFRLGYQKLQEEDLGDGVSWVEEEDTPKACFLAAMRYAQAKSGYMSIFTDDCIFYRPFYGGRAAVISNFNPGTLCFSFRLGLNTLVQDYRDGRLQPHLTNYITTGDHTLKWSWASQWWSDNYGYPVAMDGCTYSAADLLKMSEFDFGTFRAWEGYLSSPAGRQTLRAKPLMASPTKSCVANIPANSVQIPPLHHGTKFPVSNEELNSRYMSGEVIDINAMDFSNVVGCHQEIMLRFKRA